MNDDYIKQFYNEVNNALDGDYKIVLQSNRDLKVDWIEYDPVKWELEEPIQNIVKKLKKDETISFEEKIIKVFEFICLNYVYDDNVLYFFKKDVSDPENIKYIAVDWYGRIVDEKWKEKRQNHNRRICYEFSRFYAKAINELKNENDDVEAIILGYKDNTHYVVGLTGKDYSAVLDVDDFNNIKDLTRLKLGLTLNGINILRDEYKKLQNVVDKFNKNRLAELVEIEEAKKNLRGKDTIKYFETVVKILRNYHLDSQGFMEYMRSIVENEEIEIEKIWKNVKGASEKRYAGCFIFNFDNKTYLVDSIDQLIKQINIENIDRELFIFDSEKNEYDYYGG